MVWFYKYNNELLNIMSWFNNGAYLFLSFKNCVSISHDYVSNGSCWYASLVLKLQACRAMFITSFCWKQFYRMLSKALKFCSDLSLHVFTNLIINILFFADKCEIRSCSESKRTESRESRTPGNMEVVAAARGAGPVPPFQRRDVQEWSRLDQLTGMLEHARLEHDHWTANTPHSTHQYGKVCQIVSNYIILNPASVWWGEDHPITY